MGRKLLGLLAVGVIVIAVAIVAVATGLQRNSDVATCRTAGAIHRVIIQNNMMQPDHVTAKLCDTLTITNRDAVVRNIAFGEHEHHTPYDGVTERILRQGQSFTVTLDQTGTHDFHDHFHDEVQGSFTVTR